MSIFSFVAHEISEQVNQYKQQHQQCERVVGNIRTGMNPITGGAWVGQGANAFIQEVTTKLVPHIMELIAAIAGFGGNIGKAFDIVMNADKVVSGIAHQVSDVFEAIF